MMADLEMAKRLTELAQTDLDTIDAYDQAIRELSEPVIKDRLQSYRSEHAVHFQQLSNLIVDLGANAPARCPSSEKDFDTEEFESRSPGSGDAGILRLLLRNETLASHAYDEAARQDLSLKARFLVDNGRGEEKLHILYLEEALKDIERTA